MDALKTETGSIVASVVLGLGLAALFRKACKGNGCIVVRAPPRKDTADYVYRIDGNCFQYEPYATTCPSPGAGEASG